MTAWVPLSWQRALLGDSYLRSWGRAQAGGGAFSSGVEGRPDLSRRRAALVGDKAGRAPQGTLLLLPHCRREGRGLITSACVLGESGTPGGAGPAPSQARLTPSQVSGGAVPSTQEGPGWAGCLGGTELHGLPLFRGRAKSLGPLGQPVLHSGPSTGFQANLWVPQASSLLVPAPPLGSGPHEAACFLESSRELLASASPRVPSAWWSPRRSLSGGAVLLGGVQ